VKTQFGYHIIQVEEKRKRPVASFEEAKPFLEAQLRQFALAEIVGEWRKKAKIELFDINGEAVPAVEAAQEESTGEESVAE
jgi:peptidyl-prolyl cis-trans isomerase C